MTIAPFSAASITASDLADRLAPGEALTVLDVRDDASWAIEAPGVTTRRVPAAAVLADPAATARDLAGPVAVVCNRGVMAQSVSHALRAEGVDATALEGGMRGWIARAAVTPGGPRDPGARRAPGPAARPRLPVLRHRLGCAGTGRRSGPRRRRVRRTGGRARRDDHRHRRHPPARRSPLRRACPGRPDGRDPAPAGCGDRAWRGLRGHRRCTTTTPSCSATSRSERSRCPATPPT